MRRLNRLSGRGKIDLTPEELVLKALPEGIDSLGDIERIARAEGQMVGHLEEESAQAVLCCGCTAYPENPPQNCGLVISAARDDREYSDDETACTEDWFERYLYRRIHEVPRSRKRYRLITICLSLNFPNATVVATKLNKHHFLLSLKRASAGPKRFL